ncbi:hypothetical protein D3C80_2144860 [compost metagenome]
MVEQVGANTQGHGLRGRHCLLGKLLELATQNTAQLHHPLTAGIAEQDDELIPAQPRRQ